MYQIRSPTIRLFFGPTTFRPSLPYYSPPAFRLKSCLHSSVLPSRRVYSLQSSYERPCWLPVRRLDWITCHATTQKEDTAVEEIVTEPKQETGLVGEMKRLLRDAGMGRRSVWEGGVGIFVIAGTVLCMSMVQWVRGTQMRQGKPYTVTVTFPQASGISVGTPVRIRGVQIGSAIQVRPKLEAVEVKIEVHDHGVVIPKNSTIEANQSGLISEPFIDITPQVPIPQNQFGPLDMDCAEEGLVACNGSTLQGEQGVCLDDLVYMCTKLARQFDQQGVEGFFKAAESVSAALDTAQPLIDRSAQLVEEITPLLNDLRSGGLVQDVESLSKSIALAASHLEELQRAVLDHENVDALRESVRTLTNTLQSVERMANDASVFTGDHRVMNNLKRLIEAMSRMMED